MVNAVLLFKRTEGLILNCISKYFRVNLIALLKCFGWIKVLEWKCVSLEKYQEQSSFGNAYNGTKPSGLVRVQLRAEFGTKVVFILQFVQTLTALVDICSTMKRCKF